MTSVKKSKSDEIFEDSPTKITILLNKILIFLSISVFAVSILSRFLIRNLPMSRDEGSYGYLGKMAFSGKIPYLDFYEMKPPLLYYLYGLGGKIFGFTDSGMRLFALVLTVISSLFIFFIVRHYSNAVAGAISGALYAMLSLNMYCFGFSMVAEHIINALLLGTILLLIKSEVNNLRNFFLAGIVFAIACLVKQTAILFVPLFLFFIWKSSAGKRSHKIISFVSGGAVLLVLTILFLWFNGAMTEAKYWQLDYPRLYSEKVSWEKGMKYFNYFFSNIFSFSFITFGFIFFGIISAIIAINKKQNLLWLIYLVIAFVSIFPGLRFYGQYWLLIMPPLAMSISFLMHRLNKWAQPLGSVVCIFLLIAILIELNTNKAYYFVGKPSKKMDKLYTGNPFEPIKKMSNYANTIMTKNDRLLMLGSEPQVYLYTNKTAPINYTYTGFFAKNIDRNKEFRLDMMKQIEDSKPNYIMFNIFAYSWLLVPGSNTDLYEKTFNFTVNNYLPIASYELDTKRYLFTKDGNAIDAYKPNQIVLFKRIK